MIEPKTRQVYFVSVLLLIIVYCVAGSYPFKLAPLSFDQQDNGAESTPESGMHFRSPGIAHTLVAPSWLQNAIAIADFRLSLEVRAANEEQYGPARIFTLSANPDLRNITVGHHGTSLSVRIRTQRTTLNGKPDYLIKRVFSESVWHRIDILITGETLEISVDGDSRALEHLTDRPMDVWNSGYQLALGNELTGDRPWRGEVRKAVVRVGDQSFDYLAPGALHIAEKFSVTRAKAVQIVPFANHQSKNTAIEDWVVNFLGLVPFGWLIGMLRRPRSGIFLATLLAAVISATIETSQLLFLVDRTPSTEDLFFNTLGGFVGAWIAKNFDLSISWRPVDESSK